MSLFFFLDVSYEAFNTSIFLSKGKTLHHTRWQSTPDYFWLIKLYTVHMTSLQFHLYGIQQKKQPTVLFLLCSLGRRHLGPIVDRSPLVQSWGHHAQAKSFTHTRNLVSDSGSQNTPRKPQTRGGHEKCRHENANQTKHPNDSLIIIITNVALVIWKPWVSILFQPIILLLLRFCCI